MQLYHIYGQNVNLLLTRQSKFTNCLHLNFQILIYRLVSFIEQGNSLRQNQRFCHLPVEGRLLYNNLHFVAVNPCKT